MHRNSELLFVNRVRPLLERGARVLEVGPDGFPSTYQRLAADPSLAWDTIDMFDRQGLTHRATSEYSFPIADASYDVVLSGQVVEHVRMPWRWIRELVRVTRPGGLVATIAPVSWPYHEAPVDCWRIYPEGLRALYEEGGLEVQLAEWGSHEPRAWLPRFPRGVDERRRTLAFRLMRFLRWPLQRAHDTVAIGRKPAQVCR